MKRALLAPFVCLATFASADIQVIKCTILTQKGATAAELHAAEELRDHLQQITRATIPIQKDATSLKANCIVIGQGPLANKLSPSTKWTRLGEEQTLIHSKGDALLVAGGRQRGALYAVYRLLHRYAGCRWWAPWSSTIPVNPKLKFPAIDWSETPAFEYRDTFWFHAFDSDWAARNFNNGFNVKTDAAHGGKIEYQGFVHTYAGLAPPEQFFKTHPEWYSLINGQRTYVNAQLCTTNQSLRDHIVEEMRKQLRANPRARIASISQNDCYNPCQCPNCRAQAAAEGSDAALVLDLVNYVAEKLEKEFPQVAFDTLAYQWSRHPTKTMRPRKNVIVRLCSIECNFAFSLGAPENASFGDDIRGWSKLTNRLYVWNYCTNFANYLQPHPDYFTIGPSIQFFSKFGVKGVFEEGAYQSNGADMAELKAWVTAQMLWDPKQDPDKLIDEFLKGYYGLGAAPAVREYLNLMARESKGTHLGFSLGPGVPFLRRELMEEAGQTWSRALALANQTGSPSVWAFAVYQSMMPVRYVRLARWREFRNEAIQAGENSGLARTDEAKLWLEALTGTKVFPGRVGSTWPPKGWTPVTAVNEGQLTPQQFVANLGPEPPLPIFAILPPRGKNPPPPVGLPAGVDLQDDLANLWQVPENSELRGDPLASDGIACWMPGTHHEWAFQIPLSKSTAHGKHKLFAVVRCDFDAADDSRAFAFGVYDNIQRRDLGTRVLAIKDLAPGYKAYELGVFDIKPELTVWVSPASNPKVKAVWVDRIYLVKD